MTVAASRRPPRVTTGRRASGCCRGRVTVRRAQLPADQRGRHLRPGGHCHRQLLRPLRLEERHLRGRGAADQRRPARRDAAPRWSPRRRTTSGPGSGPRSGAFFDMLSQRPWIDRIVRESEFVDPGLFREYYERLARGYARGVRQAQLAGEVDPHYDPEVIAYVYTGHRQLRRHALGRLDRRRPGAPGRPRRHARGPGPRAGAAGWRPASRRGLSGAPYRLWHDCPARVLRHDPAAAGRRGGA